MTTKERIIRALDMLPKDAGIEDAIEHLYLLYKIEQGIEQADAGRVVPHEEVEKRLKAKWSK